MSRKYPDDFINKIILGDCSQVMKEIPNDSIDLVFTDPPYPRKFSYTYDYLADECPRIMKRGASLVTIVPHYLLPEVIKKFDGKLKYRWPLLLDQFDGKHARMAMGIEVTYKLMLWYVKEAYPSGRGFLRDGVKIEGTDGQTKSSGHKWEQDVSWAEYYIQKLTNEGDLVLDPLIGSGTVAEVCKKLNRNFIGIEIDEEFYEIAKRRLGWK